MGGGQKTPSTRTTRQSEASESVASGESSEAESESENEMQQAEARFTDPSSEAQEQIDAFVEQSTTGGSSDGSSDDPTEAPAAEGDSEDEGGVETGAAGAAGAAGAGAMEGTGAGEGRTADTAGTTDTDVDADADTDTDSESGDEGTTGPSPDEFDVDVEGDVSEASNGGEFARAMFSEGALSERAESESDEWGVESSREEGAGRHGSWPGFSQDNITYRESLQDSDADTGVTAEYMEVASMSGDEVDSYRAYLTEYGNDPEKEVDEGNAIHKRAVAREWQAHSQMAVTAFSRSCGVRTPDHTYDSDDEFVAAAGVNKLGRPEAKPVTEMCDEAAAKVDREEFVDVCATQHLAGNTDLHSQNVFIDDEGGVHCIDYDRGTKEYTDMASMEVAAAKAQSSAEVINRRRSDEFDVDREEITDRAQEIAVGLETTGQKERVLETVAEYDDQFVDTENNHEEIIRNNIDLAVDSARTE